MDISEVERWLGPVLNYVPRRAADVIDDAA
jgi:5-methyltetrahydrofolate--homocysteine methyltransferase